MQPAFEFPKNHKKITSGSCQGDVLTCTDLALRQSTNNNLLEVFLSLQAIHSVNVCLVLLLDGFPFELEGGRNEARFWGSTGFVTNTFT